MAEHNKNDILTLFYREGSPRQIEKITRHVAQCPICQAYLTQLQHTEKLLQAWPDTQPAAHGFNRVMQRITVQSRQPRAAQPEFSFKPILQVVLTLAGILGILYWLQGKLSLIPGWKSLQDWWLIQAFGSFGLLVLLFFLIGTFMTLALTPILLADSAPVAHTRMNARPMAAH
ncbi:hypothetical protein L0128_17205 [candidate division KSB1 bacterium]|nr:hypothetical protein [candidate division KSB1 bacterium]